jgi:hypothetical protein
MRIREDEYPKSPRDLLLLYLSVGVGTSIGLCLYAAFLS